MKSSQHLKRCFLAFISCLLVTFITAKFFGVTVPTALALTNQAGIFTDSTPSLFIYPSPLNEQNCQTSNNKTWTCIVTLEGENLAGILVFWNAYASNSSISISPNKGNRNCPGLEDGTFSSSSNFRVLRSTRKEEPVNADRFLFSFQSVSASIQQGVVHLMM